MSSVETEVHAHEVIDLIRQASPALTPEGVIRAVNERFGPAARFHTCSLQGMTVEQVVQFLLQRGKVVLHEGTLMVQEANVCRH
jgi:probable metal-binding protein